MYYSITFMLIEQCLSQNYSITIVYLLWSRYGVDNLS